MSYPRGGIVRGRKCPRVQQGEMYGELSRGSVLYSSRLIYIHIAE